MALRAIKGHQAQEESGITDAQRCGSSLAFSTVKTPHLLWSQFYHPLQQGALLDLAKPISGPIPVRQPLPLPQPGAGPDTAWAVGLHPTGTTGEGAEERAPLELRSPGGPGVKGFRNAHAGSHKSQKQGPLVARAQSSWTTARLTLGLTQASAAPALGL